MKRALWLMCAGVLACLGAAAARAEDKDSKGDVVELDGLKATVPADWKPSISPLRSAGTPIASSFSIAVRKSTRSVRLPATAPCATILGAALPSHSSGGWRVSVELTSPGTITQSGR